MSVGLETTYLGIPLGSPIVASASPLTGDLTRLGELEDAGVGAVVLPSLFEEQIEHEELEVARLRDFGAENSPESDGYFPELDDYNTGPDRYLALVEAAKQRLSVPVIASLNGASLGGWVRYARLMGEAGADAIELNTSYVPTDPALSAADVEDRHVRLVEAVRDAVDLPLAVKIGSQFSAPLHLAHRLVRAGADGLVLFNRFLHPDIDLDALRLVPHLELSQPREALLSLQWIGILRGRVPTSLAASSGVHSSDDALKLFLAGADVVMTTSAVLREGTRVVEGMLHGIQTWLDVHGYASLGEMRGSMSQVHAPEPEAYERANYMRALVSYTSDGI